MQKKEIQKKKRILNQDFNKHIEKKKHTISIDKVTKQKKKITSNECKSNHSQKTNKQTKTKQNKNKNKNKKSEQLIATLHIPTVSHNNNIPIFFFFQFVCVFVYLT